MSPHPHPYPNTKGDRVIVHGAFSRADDTPARGVVTFSPYIPVVGEQPLRVVTVAPVVAVLDDKGQFQVEVVGSDSADWRTTESIPYIITVAVDGMRNVYAAYVDGPGPYDITDLVLLDDIPPDNSPALAAAYHPTHDQLGPLLQGPAT